ncbi:MAG: hypothetical protein EA396_04375 [Anaerolineaceae bacterium]|nr:MAG: hypothetical protein EA396_04375 [Anaerolineaceae bacterium]
MSDFFDALLFSTNDILAATIVIVSASLLLYNLTRNLMNRVARVSAIVLGCVTVVYIGDVLTGLDPMLETWQDIKRLQWLGLAFVPAATFHLSDALLATTGLASRGRRRRVARLLYVFGVVFLFLALFSDNLIEPIIVEDVVSLQAHGFFALYIAYFIGANAAAMFNTWRARQRCLTRSTQRRMTYLLVALLMPGIGIFPYSALLPPAQEFTLGALTLVNLSNIIVILMLLLLAYPLSFFGSRHPDRIVKADLLRFMLVGPATGMLALAVILLTEPATQIVGVIGRDFMPFAVVTVILVWQWGVDVSLPYLERLLIYNQENDEQLAQLQNLSERLLTRTDLLQLLEATLESVCDYFRVKVAFVALLADRTPEFIKSVGDVTLSEASLQDDINDLIERFHRDQPYVAQRYDDYWVVPLYSGRPVSQQADARALIGMMGVQANRDELETEREDHIMLKVFTRRAARTVDDLLLQTEVYAALEGLLPQFTLTRLDAAVVEYRQGRGNAQMFSVLPEREQVIEQVHAALRHWWGGPGLNSSRLLELQAVQNRLPENENNGVKALRDVLTDCLERLRPDGERDFRSQEWLFYNILTLRFVENKKARDTARRLYIGEATLYRKQSAAIEALADALLATEREAIS